MKILIPLDMVLIKTILRYFLGMYYICNDLWKWGEGRKCNFLFFFLGCIFCCMFFMNIFGIFGLGKYNLMKFWL